VDDELEPERAALRAPWSRWLESLSSDDRTRAEALRDRFVELGADDPEGWARSEVSEGIAQLARFVFLRGIWTRELLRWTRPRWIDDTLRYPSTSGAQALARLRESGASAEDLSALAAYIAESVAFGVPCHIDDGFNPDMEDSEAEEQLPGWHLLEVGTNPESGELGLTGRDVAGLHESLDETRP
jgi:hypothetical protein